MARIKIDFPPNKIASVTLQVRITDLNYGNHLGNDALVSMLHEARVAWLSQHQYSELDVGGPGLIMSDLAVEYKAEAFYGDELTITLFAGNASAVGFDLYYEVVKHEKTVVAKAKTGMVCFSYNNRKVTAIPQEFLKLLQ